MHLADHHNFWLPIPINLANLFKNIFSLIKNAAESQIAFILYTKVACEAAI